MKKSFMTRVLAVSLSAAMAFSMSSASNLVTASAASTVNLKTTFKTLKVNQTYKMTLKNNTLNWKITKVTTSNKKICTVYGKTSSYVMLKGKGVGRAKITVKVKTTKRKYPKNIKLMKCTANVKAADPTTTVEEFKVTGAAANSITEVRVSFSQAIDTPDASNFTITGGTGSVSVDKAELSEDKKSVLLTIAGATYGTNYDLTVKGIKVAGKEQAEQKLTFTTPASEEKYPMTLVADKTELKSDGLESTVVTFTINDAATGQPITDKNVEVAFASDYGTFAEQRVSIQDGVAKVMFKSEALQERRVAKITATVVESKDNHDLMGLSAATSVTLSPNPGDTSIGAIITSITAPTADRIIAYFNQEVKAEDFKTKSGKLDKSKFAAEVKSGLDNGWVDVDGQTKKTEVVGIVDVDTTDHNALALLVKEPMIDNTNVSVKFTNKKQTGGLIIPENTVYTKLTDARQPGALNVTAEGLRTIKIDFSEAVLPTSQCEEGSRDRNNPTNEAYFAADNVNNYLIDGKPLSNWYVNDTPRDPSEEVEDTTESKAKKESSKDDDRYNATGEQYDGYVQVGSYKDGEDTRHVVTIKLGTKGPLSAGEHRISIANVGDWAAKTDKERNITNTEGFNFTVTSDDVTPAFEVEPQSPEQWLVTFNSDVQPVNDEDTITTRQSDAVASLLKLQEQVGSSWVDISDTDADRGKNPIRVSRVKDANGDNTNQYIVEVRNDWTEVYDTNGTRLNYYNKNLRLHMDANTIVNLANNRQNPALDVVLTGDIMKTPDTTSPKIVSVDQATDNAGNLLESYNVKMTEPVKLSAEANKESLTPSQNQSKAIDNLRPERQGVPSPSVQFINANGTETVNGIITDDEFIDAADTTFNVRPETDLGAGEWRLVVRSLSDDVENTISTETFNFQVERETVTSDFKVVWAAVSDQRNYVKGAENGSFGKDRGQYIFVKFNKPVAMVGNSTNAQVTANYTINGSTLPTGTQIYANIQGYDNHDNVTDSITIVLPTGGYAGQQAYPVDGKNAILHISNAITSATGAPLANGGSIRMPFNFGSAVSDGLTNNALTVETDSNFPVIKTLRANSDAVWGNCADERFKYDSDSTEAEGKLTGKNYYQALKNALESDQYRKVVLTHDLNMEDSTVQQVFGRNHTLTINRAVDLDLNGYDITGNVVVSTTDCVDEMRIMNSRFKGGDESKITGYIDNSDTAYTLKVTAGSIKDFTIDGVKVVATNGLAVNLNDVYKDSFVNNGEIVGNIVITDANEAGFNAGTGKWTSGKLVLNTKGDVRLEGNFAAYGRQIDVDVNQAAILRFAEQTNETEKATIDNMKVNVTSNSKDARIIVCPGAAIADNGLTINAFTEVRVTIPASAKGDVVLKKCSTDAEFKSVTAANKDLKSDTDEAIDVNADGNNMKPTNSALKNVLDELDVVNVANPTKKGDQTVTWGALSSASIKVADNKNEFAAKADDVNNTDHTDYTLEANYILVGNTVAEWAGQGNDRVIKAKADPIVNGKDTVTVELICKDRNGNVVTKVIRYIYLTNPKQ